MAGLVQRDQQEHVAVTLDEAVSVFTRDAVTRAGTSAVSTMVESAHVRREASREH